MWNQYGRIEVFSTDNGIYIFRFNDEKTRGEVLEATIWRIANQLIILRKRQPGMQLLKLSLSSIPIWIKLIHLPILEPGLSESCGEWDKEAFICGFCQ
jgi:hypothetical protein